MTTISTFQLETQRGKDSPEVLLAFLREHRGRDVEIDLRDIAAISGPQIELLLSGHRQWQSEGHSFVLANATPELTSRMIGFGIPPQLFSKESE